MKKIETIEQFKEFLQVECGVRTLVQVDVESTMFWTFTLKNASVHEIAEVANKSKEYSKQHHKQYMVLRTNVNGRLEVFIECPI